MIASLFCVAVGLGVVFAFTRSLIPSMLAHAIINVPITPRWQGVLLAVFVLGIFFSWRGGLAAASRVFAGTRATAAFFLMLLLGLYAVASNHIPAMTGLAIGMLLVALVLEALDRRRKPTARAAPTSE